MNGTISNAVQWPKRYIKNRLTGRLNEAKSGWRTWLVLEYCMARSNLLSCAMHDSRSDPKFAAAPNSPWVSNSELADPFAIP